MANVIGRLQDRLSGSPMKILERCLVKAVEQLPKLQHIVIAASPAAVEADTTRCYSDDILNADSQWIVNEKRPCGDPAAVTRTGARASPADKLFHFVLRKDGSRFSWGLSPLLVAMARHADCEPKAPLTFGFLGHVLVGTDELLKFSVRQAATFDKAMGHINNFHVRATLGHGGIHEGSAVVSSGAYEKMLSKLKNVQGLGILVNNSTVQQANVLNILLDQRFQKLQGVQCLANITIFDPAIEWMRQQLVPLLHTGQQLSDFLFRHRNTLRSLDLNCVSGVHELSPQGLEIGTFKQLVLSLRRRKRFGRLERFSIGEIVTFGYRHKDLGLPRAQVLRQEVGREASSELGKLARELNAVRKGWVCSVMSDGTIATREHNGAVHRTVTTNRTDAGAPAAPPPSQQANAGTAAAQCTASKQAETDSTAVKTARTHNPNDDNGTDENSGGATPTVVSETAAAIDNERETLEKEQLSQKDNADTSAAQAATLEQAKTVATAGKGASTHEPDDDNATKVNAEDATATVVSETAASAEGKPYTSGQRQLTQEENAGTAAAKAAASEQAETEATSGEEVNTRDSENDNGAEVNAGPTAVVEHLTFAYEIRLEAVKPDGK